MKYTFFEIDAESLFMDKPDVFASGLEAYLKDFKIDSGLIVKLECYLSVSNKDEYLTCYNTFYTSLSKSFKKQSPAAILIAQKPITKNGKAILRITICDEENVVVKHKQFQKHPYTLIQIQNELIIFSGGIAYDDANDTLRSVQGAYDFVEQLLDHEDMHFGQICHQWNYMENIESKLTDPHTSWTNIQVVNEIRNLYFDPTLFKYGYPLQSHIGINEGGFITDFVASAKDGFATAQVKSSDQQITKAIYLPALNEVHIDSRRAELPDNASLIEQTNAAINELNILLKDCDITNGVVSDLKVFLRKKEDFEVVSTIIDEAWPAKNVIYLQANAPDEGLLITIEGIIKG